MSKILIVEDEETIADLEKDYLELSGFQVEVATDGETGLKRAMEGDFDLFILDLMLPGVDGFDICRQIRSEKNTPIIMVSAKKDDIDKIRGLGLGADDYMTKPFSPRVLLARIRAQLRAEGRSSVPERKIFLHGIELDSDFHEAKVFGKSIDLTANEFGVLEMFMRSPGKVFTRDAIIRNLHGDGYPVTDRAVDVTIVNLRKKLGTNSSLIETVRGVGYRFIRA